MPAWLFASLRDYRAAWLRGDVVAGLTVWAVLIPESLAYASIAGVSPVVGLYAAVPALLLYPVFGSSRHRVVGPMSATAAMSTRACVGCSSNPLPQLMITASGTTLVATSAASGSG